MSDASDPAISTTLGQQAIDVVAAEMRVAVGRQHLEDAVLDLENRDVERAAAEVVDRDRAAVALVEAVGERRRGRLVDDAQHLEAGEPAGVARRRPLRVVEVGGHGDDRAIDLEVELALLAEVILGAALQLAQDERGDLRRRELPAGDADPDDAARLAADRERQQRSHRRCTSSMPRPMKRFTEYTVRDGAVSRRRCASRPTKIVPSSPIETTDGTSASPDSSRITTGVPSFT